MEEFEVIFYTLPNGKEPVLEFLDSLGLKMRAKMLKMLELLQKNGPALREPYSKHLDDGIFELRVQFGSDISRAFYFFFVGRKIVVTGGFIKKTEKTPPEEIDRAKACRKDYLHQQERQDHEQS